MWKIFLFLSIYVKLISWGTSQSIDQVTSKYFQSDIFKKCDDIWKKYRVGYENTIASSLKGGYGHQTMNVYISRNNDALLLTTGYLHSDNQVDILFQDVLLEEFPSLLNPEISFDLCGNALSIDSGLSKMIIHADYYLFRNRSDIIYSLEEQNSYQSSPFRFQQVQNTGQIAITAEACALTGTVLTKLDGNSVDLGVDMLKIRHCRFSVDVYTPGQKSPPVLANYLFHEFSPNGKNILEQALSKEFVIQLQAALVSHVNSSAIFGKDLLSIELQQKIAMDKVESHLDNLVRKINMQTMETKKETVNLENFNIKWNDAFDGTEKDCEISLKGITMSGLDTGYSSHIGGPLKTEGMPVNIAERLRLSNVQVLGKIGLRGMYEGEYDFAADIYDVNIDWTMDVQKLEHKEKGIEKGIRVGEWSTLEFSCPGIEELPIEAIVTGYLIEKLPQNLVSHIMSNFYKQTTSNNVEDGTDEKLSLAESGENENATFAKKIALAGTEENKNATNDLKLSQPESVENKNELTQPESIENKKELAQPESDENKNELTQPESVENKKELTQPESGENKNATNDIELTQPESVENKKELAQPESDENKNELTQPESVENKKELTQPESGENKNATNDIELTQPESGENKNATLRKRQKKRRGMKSMF